MILNTNQYPFKFHANLDLAHFQLEKDKEEEEEKLCHQISFSFFLSKSFVL